MTPTYLEIEDLLAAARRAVGGEPVIRDPGLLDAAVQRPQATWSGADVYPDLDRKAAALLHSLVMNRALLDGNKRLGWLATVLFYGLNGFDLHGPEDDVYDLVVGLASGESRDLDKTAECLRSWRSPM